MADSTRRKARPVAWAMRFPTCDGSADWAELGEQMPQQWQGAVPSPLYDDAAIDAEVADVAADRDRLHELVQAIADARQTYGWGPEADAAIEAARLELGPNA